MKSKGLLRKYNISKTNGEPIDEGAEYFILRLDDGGSDLIHGDACRQAVLTYAYAIRNHLPKLADDLIALYGKSTPTLSGAGGKEVEYINFDGAMAEYFMQHNYRAMYEYWQKMIRPYIIELFTSRTETVGEVSDEMIVLEARNRHKSTVLRDTFFNGGQFVRSKTSQPRTEGEWISVDERLPEEEVCVLGYSEEYNDMDWVILKGDRFHTREYESEGWDISEFGDLITHWTNKPMPPNTEKNKENDNPYLLSGDELKRTESKRKEQ